MSSSSAQQSDRPVIVEIQGRGTLKFKSLASLRDAVDTASDYYYNKHDEVKLKETWPVAYNFLEIMLRGSPPDWMREMMDKYKAHLDRKVAAMQPKRPIPLEVIRPD